MRPAQRQNTNDPEQGMSEPAPLHLSQLRAFSPLDGLKKENLAALARKITLREATQGRVLFKEGDTDKRAIYVVSGIVELLSGGRIVGSVHANSPQSRHPLAPVLPRRCTGRVATERVEYLAIDSDLLDVLLTWDQTGQYEVGDLQASAGGDDWMTTLLQNRAFHRIPPANLQALFLRMQRVDFSAGEVVIRQGDEGDFFYVIVSGRCVVTRETPLNREGVKLAELGLGETFGEEALVSGARRNATVTAAVDATTMRLAKEDFLKLLNEPLLRWASYDSAREVIAAGGRWLDVRLPSEFEHCRFEDALNVPLYFMRLKLSTLDPAVPYVVCCDNGRRSSAAAYLLSERGYDAQVLRGGIATTELAEALSAGARPFSG
jgi:CRP-like cAMP-binding protein